ncbi:hypothetical protein [Sedimenticola selenatireducens]|uniref:hypothetical protein n=1 Tax=Sedimenticola selenatireducens TaxID=191960 RepID=UPI002AAA675C|nr:hypothetical protein [Sedimenticola selenatireducens]
MMTKHTNNERVDAIGGIPAWARSPGARNLLNAFRRLCDGRPLVVPKGSQVSQNNVAKEAGLHPTALKKDRYPELINLIAEYKNTQGLKPKSKTELEKQKAKTSGRLKEELERVRAERDEALSKVTTLMLENLNLRRQILRIVDDPECEGISKNTVGSISCSNRD